MALGYSSGQPFGDPSRFTRSTGEDELNRFNVWMRSQPWWQDFYNRASSGGISDAEQAQLERIMQQQGVPLAGDFHVDQAGNLNQKSRTGRNLMIAGIVGGAALGGLGLAGMGPLGGLGGGAAASSGGLGAPLMGGAVPGVAGTAVAPLASTSLATGSAALGSTGGLGIGAGLANPAAATSAALGSGGVTSALANGAQIASGGGGSRLMNSILSPEGVASIASGGLGLASGLLQSGNENEQRELDREQRRRELLAQMLGQESDDDFRRQNAYMDTFNMNPVGQQQAIFRTAARGALAGQGPISVGPGGIGNVTNLGGVLSQYLNDQALAQNAARFFEGAGQLNPGASVPNLAGMGFGAGAQFQDQMQNNIANAAQRHAQQRRSRRDVLMNGVLSESGPGMQPPGQDYFNRPAGGGYNASGITGGHGMPQMPNGGWGGTNTTNAQGIPIGTGVEMSYLDRSRIR